jgi:hypothetical protein
LFEGEENETGDFHFRFNRIFNGIKFENNARNPDLYLIVE